MGLVRKTIHGVSISLERWLAILGEMLPRAFLWVRLDWRKVRPSVRKFEDLTPDERAKAGLIPFLADDLRIASEVFRQARELVGIDLTYCFIAFGQRIRLRLKDRFTSSSGAGWARNIV